MHYILGYAHKAYKQVSSFVFGWVEKDAKSPH